MAQSIPSTLSREADSAKENIQKFFSQQESGGKKFKKKKEQNE